MKNKDSSTYKIFARSTSEKEIVVISEIKQLCQAFASEKIDADYLYAEFRARSIFIGNNKISILRELANIFYARGFYTHSAGIFFDLLCISPIDSESHRLLGVIHQTNGYRTDARISHLKSMLCAHKENKYFWDGETNCENLMIIANGVGECILASRQSSYLRKYAERIGVITRDPCIELAKATKEFDFFVSCNNPTSGALPYAESKSLHNINIVRTEPIMCLDEGLLEHPLRERVTLFPDDKKLKYWERCIKRDERCIEKIIVGLCWHSKKVSPMHPNRSFKLEDLAILSKNNQIILASFQNGYGSEQLQSCTFLNRFVECQNELIEKRDFPNTIAAMTYCDYFITCDTGIAQVSCALGIKTVIIINEKPSAPWAGDGERSFYYKNAYIHRKSKNMNWEESITKLFDKVSIQELFAK